MADLQVCYFCASGPGDSVREYAVVPPQLDPTDDQQRSVALCSDCREKLTTVMEPVVEAAGTSTGADAGGSDASTGGTRGSGASAGGDPVSNRPADSGTADPFDSEAGDDPLDSGEANEPLGDATDGGSGPADGPSTGAGDDVDVPPGNRGDDDAGVSIDPDGVTGESPGESPDSFGGADEAGGPSDDGPPPESNAPRDQPHADDELVGRNNEAYNKTLRLLQNREFPVERHEIEQVAASAYQLDPQEVSDAIDALINKGLLTQEGAQLRRP